MEFLFPIEFVPEFACSPFVAVALFEEMTLLDLSPATGLLAFAARIAALPSNIHAFFVRMMRIVTFLPFLLSAAHAEVAPVEARFLVSAGRSGYGSYL